MSTNNPILNLNTINELKEFLEDDVTEIYLEFQSCTPEIIKELKQSDNNDNIESIIHATHTIKGSAGNLGLQKIFVLSQQLESDLRAGTDIDITSLITEIENSYNETISLLISSGILPK